MSSLMEILRLGTVMDFGQNELGNRERRKPKEVLEAEEKAAAEKKAEAERKAHEAAIGLQKLEHDLVMSQSRKKLQEPPQAAVSRAAAARARRSGACRDGMVGG